ncbi:hypothetical protein Tco_1497108, partial [Tanacetum coccineum]
NALGYSTFRSYPDLEVLQIVVMSSASSTVTYTFVYTDSEPGRVFWGANKEISNGGSPRVIVYGYDGLPIQPVAPPSPDYIPDSEEPQIPPVPQDEDEQFLAEEQPLPPVVSPTADSPGYDSPVDCLIDGGDDGDDDDGDSSKDDADDEDEDVIPPPSTDITTTGARITVWLQASISLLLVVEVERLLDMPTPSPSAPISLSPPSAGERLARCTASSALVDAVTAVLPSPLLPPLPPSLYIPPPVDRMNDIPESEQPPSKRLCLSTLGSRYKIGESSTARPIEGRGIDYGFVSTVDAEARRQGISEVG